MLSFKFKIDISTIQIYKYFNSNIFTLLMYDRLKPTNFSTPNYSKKKSREAFIW